MSKSQYVETFDDDHGGWTGRTRQGEEMRALELGPSSVTARSPFILDSTHASPGPGYLQIGDSRGYRPAGRIHDGDFRPVVHNS